MAEETGGGNGGNGGNGGSNGDRWEEFWRWISEGLERVAGLGVELSF